MPFSLGRHRLLGKIHYDALTADVEVGDLIYGNAVPKWARLPKGADGKVLMMVSGLPAWGDVAAGAHNLLSTQHLDTLPDSVLAGDLIYGNATPKWARLAKGLDGQYLKLVAGLPVWADPPAAADHNLLSTVHPDTLAAAVVRGDLIVGNATPKWSRLGIGVSARYLRSDGLDPAWAQIDHAELINVLPNQHHAQLHALDSASDHSGIITDAQHGSRGAGLHADSHPQLHKDSHKTGGGDAFLLADLLDCVARLKVRKNTGASDVGARRRLNLIEGTNVTLTVADDPTDEEVDVTIAAAGGGAGANVKSGQATGGTVTFTTPFASTPNIVLTPFVASPAASTIYTAHVVTKDVNGFTYKCWSHSSFSTFTDITSTQPVEWIATNAGNP